MSKVLLIDLDDTLLDTNDLKLRIFEKLEKMGVKDCARYYIQSKVSVGPENRWNFLAKKLEQEYSLKKNKIFEIINREVKKIKINKNILKFLKKFKGKKIIFSLGDEDFQLKKIEAAKLKKYVDKILITNLDKSLFLKQFLKEETAVFDGVEYSDVTLLDDRVELISRIKNKYPWIKSLHVSDIIN